MNRTYFSILLLIFVVLVPSLSTSQHNIKLLDPIHNTYYSENNNEIWIASCSEGYNRYNGVETYHYSMKDSLSGLEGTYIQSSLYPDGQGRLWTTTYENICYFDYKTDRFYCDKIIDGNVSLDVGYKIYQIDYDDMIWLKANDRLFVYNPNEKTIVENLGVTNGMSYAFKDDLIAGAPWLRAKGLELWIKTNENWTRVENVFSACPNLKDVQAIKCLWFKDQLWVLSDLGLIEVNIKNPCNSILHVHYDEPVVMHKDFVIYDSLLLIGSDSYGIQIFDLMNKKFQNSYSHNLYRIDQLYITETDQLFFSDYSKGINCVPITKVLDRISSILPVDVYWKSIQKGDNYSLFLASNSDLYISDSKIGSLEKLKSNIQNIEIWKKDYLIACSHYDIMEIDVKNELVISIKHSWKQFQGMKLIGNRLIVIADNTMFIYNKVRGQWTEEKSDRLNNEVQNLGYIDSDITILPYNGTMLHIEEKNDVRAIDISRFINGIIYHNNSNTYFIYTNQGLFSMIGSEDLKVDLVVPDVHVYSAIVCSDKVYFNTSDGRIGRYDIVNKSYIYSTKNLTGLKKNFDIYDDKIYVGSDHLAIYNEEDYFKSNQRTLTIDKFCANEICYNISDEQYLTLAHDQNSISLSASLDNWNNAKLTQIEYRINPIKKTWTTIGNHSEVNFPSLSPNDYELEIRATAADGHQNSISHSFKIRKPWYDSISARISYVLLLASFFYLLYLLRTNKIKKKYKIQEEIRTLEKAALQAQMNPHFIFNCLNSIQGFIMDNEKEQAMEYLGGFAQLIRSNLNASTSATISLFEEHRILHNYLKLERLRLNNSFEFEISLPYQKDASDIMIPPMLIQPFVENAVIHGMRNGIKDGLIKIVFSLDESRLNVRITDNGDSKLPPVNIAGHKSVGVDITRKRLNYINQSDTSIEDLIIDHTSSGTIVTLSILLD